MKLLLIVAALFLANASAFVIKPNSECDEAHLIQCASTFAYQLGLSGLPLSPKQLDDTIQNLLSKGPAGKKQVCDADINLQLCLANEYKSCFTVDYLKSIGLSAADAQGYVDEANKLQQMCKSSSNDECDQERFMKCTETFVKDLGMSEIPKDAQQFVDQVNKLIGSGKQDQVCNADKAWIKCFGDQYDSCIALMKQVGQQEKDVKLFVDEVLHLQNDVCKSTLKSNAQCDEAHLIQCASTFSYQLGLSGLPLSPKQLDDAIQKLLAQGDKQKVCNADDGLQKCLADEYKSCFTVDYLKSLGLSAADAQGFVDEANKLQQMCKSGSNAQCEMGRFDKCTDAFAKGLGLPSMPTDASVLDAQMKKLLAQGPQGKKQVCDAGMGLMTCLGDEYKSCISVDFLKSIGESQKDAQQFVDLANQMEQMCMSSSANAQCDVAHLIQCSSTFAYQLGLPNTPLSPKQWSAAIQKLLNQGDKQKVCNAFDGFQKCLADEYKSCFTVDYLKSIGISAADAQAYVDGAKKLQQTCKSSPSPNAQCDNTKFSQCTDTFAKALGLSAMPNKAQELIDQVNKLMNGGQKTQVCNADNALVKCLGDQYDSCISIDYLKSIGISDIDAAMFVFEANYIKTVCLFRSNANAQCDASRFQQCTNTFAQALGLPYMPTEPTQLIDQINKLLAQGPSGKTQVCNAFKDMQKCFGDQYDSCISVDFLKSIGETDQQAKLFVDEAAKIKNMCA